MSSLFFIDPNNENANLRVCAVGERRLRSAGNRHRPGSTLRLFLPVIYRKNRPPASRVKGVFAKRPNCKTLVERRPGAAQAFDA
jgi:hypothetical protein